MNRQAAKGSAGRSGAVREKKLKPRVDLITRLKSESSAIAPINAMENSPGGITSAEIFSDTSSEDMNEGLLAKKIHSIKK